MIFLLDVNVLLALALQNHHHHGAARVWLSHTETWATTPVTEMGFVRLMTNSSVAGYEIPTSEALDALNQMRRLDAHRFLQDDTSLADPRIDLGTMVGTKQVTDFHLVNLAARHAALFATFDGSLVRTLQPDDRQHVHLIDW